MLQWLCAHINSIQRERETKYLSVYMHHPHVNAVFQSRTVRIIQCVLSLMMLQLATEESKRHTDNGMISLPMFTTVVRRQACSLIQNINRMGSIRNFKYSASALCQSFSRSVEFRQLGRKIIASTVESIHLGHALHNILQRRSQYGRHNRREKLLQLVAFPFQ